MCKYLWLCANNLDLLHNRSAIVGWSEADNKVLICNNVWAANEIDAIWHSCKYFIKRLPDGLWLAWQVENQCLATNSCCLPGKNCGRYIFERNSPHLLTKARHQLATNSLCCFRSDIPLCWACASCCDHQATFELIDLRAAYSGFEFRIPQDDCLDNLHAHDAVQDSMLVPDLLNATAFC